MLLIIPFSLIIDHTLMKFWCQWQANSESEWQVNDVKGRSSSLIFDLHKVQWFIFLISYYVNEAIDHIRSRYSLRIYASRRQVFTNVFCYSIKTHYISVRKFYLPKVYLYGSVLKTSSGLKNKHNLFLINKEPIRIYSISYTLYKVFIHQKNWLLWSN